jgi:energy-coupling factor transporter ATP-binding protein EcfA2
VKIKTLSLTDFRAFPGPAPTQFDLDGKNLLVYGENGSGKSSLFHALQGLFSRGKPSDLLSMRNSFSAAEIGCVKVSVDFDDQSTAAWQVSGSGALQRYGDPLLQGPIPLSVHPGHSQPLNANVTEAAKFSAVLDYRSLLNTNFKYGDGKINLFQLAVDISTWQQTKPFHNYGRRCLHLNLCAIRKMQELLALMLVAPSTTRWILHWAFYSFKLKQF